MPFPSGEPAFRIRWRFRRKTARENGRHCPAEGTTNQTLNHSWGIPLQPTCIFELTEGCLSEILIKKLRGTNIAKEHYYDCVEAKGDIRNPTFLGVGRCGECPRFHVHHQQ